MKKRVSVPVIAVGRLGDPATAEHAVSQGKTDFIALGRTLIAEPQWVEKVRRGEPIRRCLSCNTCINEMRGGARIGCVVNGAAGRETLFAAPQIPQGERIAVIGAGPAGLTYASLVAEGNHVTVFEKETQPGGAFNFAAKAPLFQEVNTEARSFTRYIDDLFAACRAKGVQFRLGADAGAASGVLAGFDTIVVATGAQYRFGLRPFANWLLDTGIARARHCAAVHIAVSAQLVLLQGAARHRVAVPPPGAAGAAPYRDRRRRACRQKQGGDRRRIPGGVAGDERQGYCEGQALVASTIANNRPEEPMAAQLHRVKIAPKGMGLNDFVAMRRVTSLPRASTSSSIGKRFAARNQAGRVSTICNARRIVPTYKINPT